MAQKDVDFSFLDRPAILGVIFYPRKSFYRKPSKPNAKNHLIEVEKGIKIGCRFYTKGLDCPSLLYFHGNGEIVDDYDWSAPFYNRIGVNLFVADYRGYGFSDGTPTISNMIKDSHQIFKEFSKIVEQYGFRKSVFVMGRSLGSIPAIEVVYHYQNDVQGLIIESGSANNFRYFFDSLIPSNNPILSDDSKFLNKVKLRSISKPTLIIHAEHDTLVPLKEGKELYDNSAAKDKRFLKIPNAEHNNLMIVGEKQYFKAIEEFVKTHS
jgi:alpha-beta hydrolase superfamily lysophospholipase